MYSQGVLIPSIHSTNHLIIHPSFHRTIPSSLHLSILPTMPSSIHLSFQHLILHSSIHPSKPQFLSQSLPPYLHTGHRVIPSICPCISPCKRLPIPSSIYRTLNYLVHCLSIQPLSPPNIHAPTYLSNHLSTHLFIPSHPILHPPFCQISSTPSI